MIFPWIVPFRYDIENIWVRLRKVSTAGCIWPATVTYYFHSSLLYFLRCLLLPAFITSCTDCYYIIASKLDCCFWFCHIPTISPHLTGVMLLKTQINHHPQLKVYQKSCVGHRLHFSFLGMAVKVLWHLALGHVPSLVSCHHLLLYMYVSALYSVLHFISLHGTYLFCYMVKKAKSSELKETGSH